MVIVWVRRVPAPVSGSRRWSKVIRPPGRRVTSVSRRSGSVVRLHGIARAALAGALDRDALLAMDPAQAAERLRELRGIGPFWSDGIVLRAVGPTDALTLGEPRLRERAATRYGRPRWRPTTTRSWPWPRAGGRGAPGSPCCYARRDRVRAR